MLADKTINLPFLKESTEIGDLKSKSNSELQELLRRQMNLLANKFVISKLKDKGKKIKDTKERIEAELHSRDTIKVVSQDNNIDINACEWRLKDETRRNINVNVNYNNSETNEKDVLQILAENGQISKSSSKFKNTPHIQKLIDTENEQKFSFKPNNPVVSTKLKKIIPEAHTEEKFSAAVKSLNLPESMELLTSQFSTLKLIERTSSSKRAEECIEDRINESNGDNNDTDANEECAVND